MLQGLQKAETRPLILLDCLLVAWYFTIQKPCWHTLECGCTHMCVCLHAYIWKLGLHLSCYPPMSTIFLFFLSRVLELTNLARQAGWPPSGIRLLLPSQDWNYKCVCQHVWLFDMSLQDGSEVLIFASKYYRD